jgi:peptide/nickel transport system substrate-binding protein
MTSELTRRGVMLGAAAAPVLMTLAQARAQGVAPKKGGTLTSLLTPEPPILVLGVNGQGPTLIVASKIYQGLITYSDTMQPMPVLAKSWTVSDDKLTYTFHLQPNVTFHDGTPFTADDVVFSVMQFAMTLSSRARNVFSQIDKASALDPLTAVFTLKAPYEPFMLSFPAVGCPIVPKHIYDGTDYRNNPHNAVPIGTGPFKFAEWQRGNFIRLRRNENYWKPDQPYLDEIIYRIVPDGQSRALALQTGQVQLAAANDIEPFDLPRFQQQPGLTTTMKGWEYYSPLSWFEVNQRVKPLDDVRVRQAISRAIDRDFIVKRLWFGIGKPATGPLAATVRFYDPGVTLPPYDPAAARALLDEAGLKPDANGVRFTIKHMPLPYGEVWNRLSEYFRASMDKIGIKVVMDPVDAGAWAARMAAWEYDTSVNFVYQVGDPSYSVEGYYLSSNIRHVTFTNTSGYNNPKVDEMFIRARNLADSAERAKIFAEIQKILVQEMPYIYLVQMSYPTYYASRLRNVIDTGLGPHASFDDVFYA